MNLPARGHHADHLAEDEADTANEGSGRKKKCLQHLHIKRLLGMHGLTHKRVRSTKSNLVAVVAALFSATSLAITFAQGFANDNGPGRRTVRGLAGRHNARIIYQRRTRQA